MLKKSILLFKMVIVCFAISSLSLFFGTFADFDRFGFPRTLAYIIATVFWLFLALGYYLFYRVSQRRIAYEKKHNKADYIRRQKHPGIITFFSNKWASLADLSAAVFTLWMLIILFVPTCPKFVIFFVVAAFTFTVQLHAALNGINFKYILYISKKRGE